MILDELYDFQDLRIGLGDLFWWSYNFQTQTLIDSFLVNGVEPYNDAGTEFDFKGVILVFFWISFITGEL